MLFFLVVFCFWVLADSTRVLVDHALTLQNIYVGAQPGKKIPFTLSLTNSIDLLVQDNLTLFSGTAYLHPQKNDTLYDYVHINARNSYFSAFKRSNKNQMTLGWLAAQTGCGITFIYPDLYYCNNSKRLLGKPLPLLANAMLAQTHCVSGLRLLLPNKTLVLNFTLCLQESSQNLVLPFSFGAVDRTTSNCYSLPDLFSTPFCTQDSVEADFVVQNKNQAFVGLGLLLQNKKIAISQEYEQQYLWASWDEAHTYNFSDVLSIGATFTVFLLWALILTHQTTQFQETWIFIIGALKLPLYFVILHEIFNRDLFFRVRYVQFDHFTKFGQIYLVFGGILLLLLVVLDLYTMVRVNTKIQATTFETLLATTVIFIFIGQTNLVEESSICFITAIIWIVLQTRNMLEYQDPGAALSLLLFPLAVTTCIEPIIRIFPSLYAHSFSASVVLLLVAVVTLFFYQTLCTKILCK